jgi:hypothetical protein
MLPCGDFGHSVKVTHRLNIKPLIDDTLDFLICDFKPEYPMRLAQALERPAAQRNRDILQKPGTTQRNRCFVV